MGLPNAEEYEAHQEIYIPEDLNVPLNSSDAKEILRKIREFYFDSSNLSVENILLNASVAFRTKYMKHLYTVIVFQR